MKVFEPQDIRNVALIGHKGCGKTSLAEAALWSAKATSRLGSTQGGTSVLDFEAEEQKRVMSTSTSVAALEWKKHKVNLLDTPGDANFLKDTRMSLPAADAALCVVSGRDGVEPMTERVFGWAADDGLVRAFFVSKLDADSADFDRTLQDIKEHVCREATAVQIPIGSGTGFRGLIDLLSEKAFLFEPGDEGRFKVSDIPQDMVEIARDARNQLIEDIASNDEELMEKFFEEALTNEEIVGGLSKAMRAGQIVPVYGGSGTTNHGVSALLDIVVTAFPAPTERAPWPGKRNGAEARLEPDPNGPLTCFAFKTLVDQHAGKISVMRVLSGRAKGDTTLENATRSSNGKERLGALHGLLGKKLLPIDEAPTGDIFAVAKLKDVHTGDTLASDGFRARAAKLLPPLIARAVHAKDKSQEDKVVTGLQRIIEEDPGLSLGRDEQNGEVLLSGTGQQHIEVAVEKMQRKFGVDCELTLPRIPYQETFTVEVKAVEGKHKKQSGGHGQFGVVYMDFQPGNRGEGLTFEDAVVGGSVPRQFIPSVEKGLHKAMSRGVIAGYPVVDLRVRLYDGKHHPVDSSDMAFQVAASKGFKAAAEQARPVLLEPIMDMEIIVPDENIGDVMGDVSTRRGRVVGSEPVGKYVVIKAQIPLAEIQTYEAALRSMTQGRGSFTVEPNHMEPVPPLVQEKIVKDSGFTGHEEED